MKSSYAKDIKIITTNPYFHSLVARIIPKQPQQSNQNNNNHILFIILLGSLYYFIELYVKIKTRM